MINGMKVYQLIYTCAKHGLSDSELGVKNEPGLGVYSCSQGLSRDNINEIKRFCTYHLPDDIDLTAADNTEPENIPDMFPKIFRTFKLSDGKTAVLQSVYAGKDYTGKQGNFLTHVLIADEKESIIPERYYKSKTFRKYLSEEELESPLVMYLPVIENADSNRNLTKNIESFINEHKAQISVLFQKLISVLTSNDKNHLMIASENADDVDMYLLSLKYLLPKSLSMSFGISTYNIYLPSNSQNKILLHGTIKGKNNIEDEDITDHPECLYADADEIPEDSPILGIFNKPLKELYREYEEYNVKTADELAGYLDLEGMDNVPELSDKLSGVKKNLGEEVFKRQCLEIFDNIDDEKYDSVRFEILDIMCSHIDVFPDKKNSIIKRYISYGISSICAGNSVNIEKVFQDDLDQELKKDIIASLPEYMEAVVHGKTDKKNGMLILRVLSMIKTISGKKYWHEFFNENEEYLKAFVKISMDVVINDTVPVTFTAPQIWNKTDLSETVAYIDASTYNEDIKNGCRKYILSNSDEEWQRLGIVLKTTKKNEVESAKDIMKIRQLLSQVGYTPFSKRSYGDIKLQITDEINQNDNPLMVARLLSNVYAWQSLEGQLNESKLTAEKIYDSIMELKTAEKSCYDYIFPKLGIEILNSPGHYHEIIINADTMEPEFWNWFLIAYNRNKNNEDRRLVYQRVYEASSRYLKNVAVKERLDRLIINADIED